MKFDDWMTSTDTTNPAFGKKAGWSAETVRRYRSGIRDPGIEEMSKIFELTDGAVTPNDWAGVGPRSGGEAEPGEGGSQVGVGEATS